MSSGVYFGTLAHARRGEVAYRFRYPLYFAAVDVDGLDDLARTTRLFSRSHLHVFGLRDADYQDAHRGGLRAGIERVVSRADGDASLAHIELITQLSVFGYVFNPVSFYLCFDRAGAFECVVAEVNNTYGQGYRYVLDHRNQVGERTFETDKRLYVSPFIDADMTYRWSFPSATAPQPDRHDIRVAVSRRGRAVFRASLRGQRREFSDRALVAALVRHPLLPAQIIAKIYWHAAALRVRGRQYRPPPGADSDR